MPTFSFDLTAQQANRLSVAFGKFFSLKDQNDAPRNATAADVETYVKNEVKKIVLLQERADAEAALANPEF